MKKLTQKFIKKLINDRALRIKLTKDSHLFFFHVYLNEYVTYPIADFHKEMFDISQNDDIELAAFCSFRGSGKSTLMTLSYPLWSILGKPQKKFVVLISQTAEQAKLHFKNLKRELETNDLLKQDLGPFQQQDEWNNCSLVIPRYNAKIIAVSKEQSFRGIRHGANRPDLIIADDVEDRRSVQVEESRNSTYSWFTSEVLPLGARNTKKIVVGNLLHEDSLLMRLSSEIETGTRSGIFRRYPLVDEYDNILWPGKYPDMQAVEKEEKAIGDKFSWLQEFMLIIVDDQEPVIEPEWMHYYQEIPEIRRNEGFAFAGGVDLAVSEREKADFTAIVSCKIIGDGDEQYIYISPNPINSKMQLPVTIDTIRNLVRDYEKNANHCFYIEEVGTQRGLTQLLNKENIKAIGVSPGQNDKRARLSLVSEYIRSGKVKFPEKGIEELKKQILDFGLTRHDDLADAFTTLILGIMQQPPSTFNISHEDMQKFRKDMYNAIYDRSGGISSRSAGMGPGYSSSIEFTDSGIIRRY